jgi:hypothetical protein
MCIESSRRVAIWKNGTLRHAGQVEICGEMLRVFADSLGPEDEVAIEARCNTHAIVCALELCVARAVVSSPMRTRAVAEAMVKTDMVELPLAFAAICGSNRHWPVLSRGRSPTPGGLPGLRLLAFRFARPPGSTREMPAEPGSCVSSCVAVGTSLLSTHAYTERRCGVVP